MCPVCGLLQHLVGTLFPHINGIRFFYVVVNLLLCYEIRKLSRKLITLL